MRAILDLMLPPACAGCGSAGALLCSRCLDAASPASDPACRFVAVDPAIAIGQDLSLALAAFAFEGPIRMALARLKYEGASRLAGPLAQAAMPTLRVLLQMTGGVPLVPVPVHRERLRERGYNQAELIARAMGSAVGLPVIDRLKRVRPTTKQHRLDRAARLANLRAAFSVLAAPTSMPAAVIVVDDIVTTTATLEACASVLRSAGVREVYGFAVAREI
jgi:ComF family protein